MLYNFFCAFWQIFYVPFDLFLRGLKIFQKSVAFFLFRNATEENEEEIVRRHHLLKGIQIYCFNTTFFPPVIREMLTLLNVIDLNDG